MSVAGYEEFEIDIEAILREQLPARFVKITPASLTLENVQNLPAAAKGAYVLLESGKYVYAGKTDARHGFRSRLERHAYSLKYRKNIDPNAIAFIAVRIMVFSNFDVETILIKQLRQANSSALAWNNSGFGSNDPGHRREHQEPAKFDVEHPVDVDRPLTFLKAGGHNVRDLLILLKRQLPYDFRYETDIVGKKKNGHPKYAKDTVGHQEQRAASITLPRRCLQSS